MAAALHTETKTYQQYFYMRICFFVRIMKSVRMNDRRKEDMTEEEEEEKMQ